MPSDPTWIDLDPELTSVYTSADLKKAAGNLNPEASPARFDLEPPAKEDSLSVRTLQLRQELKDAEEALAIMESEPPISAMDSSLRIAAREDVRSIRGRLSMPDAHLLAPPSAIDFPSALTVALDEDATIDTSYGGLAGASAYDHEYLADIEVNQKEEVPTPCEFLTGCAGTGKSFTMMQRIQEDPMYAMLAAS